MITVRPYRKLDWFEFLDIINDKLKEDPTEEIYFSLIDELYMRKVNSISEGGTYKLKAPAKNLLSNFELKRENEPEFCTDERFAEFCKQVSYITTESN